MTRDYGADQRRRDPYTHLLYPLGVSAQEIADALGVSLGTIQKDLSRFEDRPPKDERPTREADIFRALLSAYAAWHTERAVLPEGVKRGLLFDIVRNRLGVWDLLQQIEVAIGVCREFALPRFDPNDRSCRAACLLLHEVFPHEAEERWLYGVNLKKEAEKLFEACLAECSLDQGPDFPDTLRKLRSQILEGYLSTRRGFVGPIWHGGEDGEVLKAIALLQHGRQEEIVLRTFGFPPYNEPQNLTDIATALGLSVDRVRVVLDRAIRRLQHPSRSTVLRPLAGLGTELPKAVELAPPPLTLEQFLGQAPWRVMELSVRATNCLQFGNIGTLLTLVTRTEPELLRISNFGRKCLKEVREALAKLGRMHPFPEFGPEGLRFGMTFTSSAG